MSTEERRESVVSRSNTARVRSRAHPRRGTWRDREAAAADRRAHLNAAAAHWHVLRLSTDIEDRAIFTWVESAVRQLHATSGKMRLTFLFPPVNRRVAGSNPA